MRNNFHANKVTDIENSTPVESDFTLYHTAFIARQWLGVFNPNRK